MASVAGIGHDPDHHPAGRLIGADFSEDPEPIARSLKRLLLNSKEGVTCGGEHRGGQARERAVDSDGLGKTLAFVASWDLSG